MLVIIKAPPDSPEAALGVGEAALKTADIILAGAAVALAKKGGLDGFCGTAYACKEDLESSGIEPSEMEKAVKVLTREELLSLIAKEKEVRGSF